MQFLRTSFFIFLSFIGEFLVIFPELDIAISKQFYAIDGGFIYSKSPIVSGIFKSIPLITQIWCILCTLVLFISVISKKDWKELIKSPAFFLLLAALLGPALTVSYGFKEHVGRARPRDIVEFAGTKNFTPVLETSSECITNCSFSSAHAAIGFYFTALAWIVSLQYQNIVFLIGVLLGSVVGFGRILQGGHFFSDIVFSFIVVMIMNELSFKFWFWIKDKIKSQEKNAIKK